MIKEINGKLPFEAAPRRRPSLKWIPTHLPVLGRSQQAVAKLFEQTIPELAIDGVAVVLLDELKRSLFPVIS